MLDAKGKTAISCAYPKLAVTVDDAKFYTKPSQLMKANYYWMKDQDFEETFCVPSEALEYKNKVATPSGNEAGVK